MSSACWSGVDSEQGQPLPAPKPGRKQVPLLTRGPGEARSATSSEQDVLGTALGLASPGLMKAQDSASGQNSQAFPCPYSRQRLASATPSVTLCCLLWLKPSVSSKQQQGRKRSQALTAPKMEHPKMSGMRGENGPFCIEMRFSKKFNVLK